MYILPIFSCFRPLASSFTARSSSYHCRTIPLAQGVNAPIGHLSLGGTVRGLGALKCSFCPFSPVWRPIARSLIDRSAPVRHRTIPRAECVSGRTREFSQGHKGWGLGPPKCTFCRFLPHLAACSEHIYEPIATFPPSYDSSGAGRQCSRCALFARGTVRGLGPPNVVFLLSFSHFGGL